LVKAARKAGMAPITKILEPEAAAWYAVSPTNIDVKVSSLHLHANHILIENRSAML
jgi:hypothetical protein